MVRLVDTSVALVVLDFYGEGTIAITLLDSDGWGVKKGSGVTREIAKGRMGRPVLPHSGHVSVGADLPRGASILGADP